MSGSDTGAPAAVAHVRWPARLYAPWYWPTWLALGLLRGLVRLSYPTLLRIGAALGGALWHLPLPQKRVVRRNIALCLPELDAAARERLARQHFREAGITLGETALAWFAPPERLLSMVRFEGLEELDRLRASGRGAILLAAHFTTLEIGARFATAARPVHAVYKPSQNALLEEAFRRYRGAVSAGMVASDDIRAMVRVLKAGGAVWYAPDQAFRGKGARMVPFFGTPAAANTATSRLARMTGAAVLPYFVERLPVDGGPAGQGPGTAAYVVRIGAPLADFPGADEVEDTLRHHHLIEAEARRLPAQYLWLHKRFKGLTPDYPDPYAR
ncbi:MAG: lysophospholipid acyltransferase family protein [Gammaproteobacteria bacterium]